MIENKDVFPQQVGIAIPPLIGSVVVGGFDPRDSTIRALNLGGLVEQLITAEILHTNDRIDERKAATVTIPTATGVGSVIEGSIVVPADEVWYLNRLTLGIPAVEATTSAGVSANILVSSFPKGADGKDKPYLAADQLPEAAVTSVTYDLTALGQLGAELRVVGGDKLTIRATVVTAVLAVNHDVVLTPFGRGARQLL